QELEGVTSWKSTKTTRLS
ncbi:hypothetical protein QTP86_023589, partial [Hemibagrus guttatus]